MSKNEEYVAFSILVFGNLYIVFCHTVCIVLIFQILSKIFREKWLKGHTASKGLAQKAKEQMIHTEKKSYIKQNADYLRCKEKLGISYKKKWNSQNMKRKSD